MNKKVIIGSIIAVITIGLIAVGIMKASAGGSVILVKTAEIEKGIIASYISSDGVIEEVDKVEVFFDTPLKVSKVLVEQGQRVTKGQLLLELDLEALNSQLETLKINRNTQKISLDSKTMDAEVERAANSLKAAERNFDSSKKTFEENKTLYNANAISKAALDMSEKAFIEAESGMGGVKNAQIAYNIAVESRKNAKLSGQSSLKVMDIQISDLEKKLSAIKKDCSSNMNGVITSLGVKQGSFINSMQAAYKIINPDKLQVRAKVKEFDVKSVAVGQVVRITGEAIDKSKEIAGRVKSISPVAVTSMNSIGNESAVEVLVEADGAGDVLKPGFNVTCEISTVNKKDALLAPMEAIMLDKDENNMVFVVDESTKTILQKYVTVGINSDMNVEILEGLSEGELVVLDPQPTYKDGLRVRVSEKDRG